MMQLRLKLWHGMLAGILFAASLVWAADSRITDLSALTTAASGDVQEIVDVSDATDNAAGSSRKITLANLATFFWTAPSFTAGSASAGTWPKLNSGTVMTTAEDGAFEEDADALYHATDAGNRGVIPVRHFIRADTTRTLASQTAAQAIFNSPTNGRITLETGTYLFDMVISVNTMSATSGNAAISFAGTATTGSFLWATLGVDGATATAATWQGDMVVTSATPASMATAGTATVLSFIAKGSFEVTAAGTVIPSIALVTANAAVVAVGSYISLERVGSTSVVSVGQWD